jgi:conjugal transfer pilus assembly protein TraA
MSGAALRRHAWSKNMDATAMKEKAKSLLPAAAAVALVAVAGADVAIAGTDGTFDTALTKFTDFLEGSGGKIITVLSLAGGIVALASGRFSLGQVAIPVGVGVGAGTGVPIVTSTVTATI